MKLSNSKLEALSLRLKFATGTQNEDLINTIIKNHRHNGTEVIKGFIQELIIATLRKTTKEFYQRQLKSSNNLDKNKEIPITLFNKGGRAFIMKRNTYNEKN